MSNARISSPWRSDEGYLVIRCNRVSSSSPRCCHHCSSRTVAAVTVSLSHYRRRHPLHRCCHAIIVIVALPLLSLSPCHCFTVAMPLLLLVAMPSLLLSRRCNHHTIVVAITAVAIPPWSLLRCHRCSRHTCCRKEQQRSTMIMTTCCCCAVRISL